MTSKQDRGLIAEENGTQHVPSIVMVVLQLGQSRIYELYQPVIICLIDGKGAVRFDDGSVAVLSRKHLFIITEGKVVLTARSQLRIILCRTPQNAVEFLPEIAFRSTPSEDASIQYTSIRINKLLKHFFAGILLYLENGIADETLSPAKMTELVWIISHSYEQEDYERFFRLMITQDATFRLFACRHAALVSTVERLAEMMNVSVRTLNEYFRERIGMSPKAFLKCERAKRIANKLLDPYVSLKAVALEEGVSVQQLNRICRNEFDMPPAQIRAKCIVSRQKKDDPCRK